MDYHVDVTLAGVTPLLTNKMPKELLLRLRGEGPPPGFYADENGKLSISLPKAMAERERQARERERPLEERAAEDAPKRVYRLPSGDPCVPRPMFLGSLVFASIDVKLHHGRQVTTAKNKNLTDLFYIGDEIGFPLLDPETGEPAKYEPDIQMGRDPNFGNDVPLFRARFDKWMFRCRVTGDEEKLSRFIVRRIFDIAGSRVGIGDFRPQRKGTFGKFEVLSWEIVQETSVVRSGVDRDLA